MLLRAWGLLARPRATWDAIAAEGDTRRALWVVYLPSLLAASWAACAAVAALAHGWEAPTRPGEGFAAHWSGTVGTAFASMLAGPAFLLVNVLAALFVGWRARANAPRYGAAPDRAAAGKLALYGWTPVWLAWPLLPVPGVGSWLFLGGVALALRLFALGAPRLMPPAPGFEAAFGRTVAWRAGLAGLLGVPLFAFAFAVTALAALLLAAWPFPAAPPGMSA